MVMVKDQGALASLHSSATSVSSVTDDASPEHHGAVGKVAHVANGRVVGGGVKLLIADRLIACRRKRFDAVSAQIEHLAQGAEECALALLRARQLGLVLIVPKNVVQRRHGALIG